MDLALAKLSRNEKLEELEKGSLCQMKEEHHIRKLRN